MHKTQVKLFGPPRSGKTVLLYVLQEFAGNHRLQVQGVSPAMAAQISLVNGNRDPAVTEQGQGREERVDFRWGERDEEISIESLAGEDLRGPDKSLDVPALKERFRDPATILIAVANPFLCNRTLARV